MFGHFDLISIPLENELLWVRPISSQHGGIYWVNEAEVGGMLKLAQPIMAPMFRRQGDEDFAKLKAVVEAQAAGGG